MCPGSCYGWRGGDDPLVQSAGLDLTLVLPEGGPIPDGACVRSGLEREWREARLQRLAGAEMPNPPAERLRWAHACWSAGISEFFEPAGSRAAAAPKERT